MVRYSWTLLCYPEKKVMFCVLLILSHHLVLLCNNLPLILICFPCQWMNLVVLYSSNERRPFLLICRRGDDQIYGGLQVFFLRIFLLIDHD